MIREKRTVNCWLLTNKGNCEGKPTKPLQLPFILPIELITAFLNFQKLISIRFGQQTELYDAYRPFLKLYRPFPMHYKPFWSLSFQKPNRNKTKKGASRPQIAEAHLASSSFKNYFQTRRLSSPILTKLFFSKPMTTAPFAWFPLRKPSWLSLSEVVLDCTNLSCNSYQYCENHT